MTLASPHQSKTKLLGAAFDVIRAKGYAASTVDDICHAAGVTKGSFFHHFKSKDDLALSAAAYWGETTDRILCRGAIPQAGGPIRAAGRLRRFPRRDPAGRRARLHLPARHAAAGDLRDASRHSRRLRQSAVGAYRRSWRRDIEAAKRLYAPTRNGAPTASAISSKPFCRARSFSPRRSKARRWRVKAWRTCADIWRCCSIGREKTKPQPPSPRRRWPDGLRDSERLKQRRRLRRMSTGTERRHEREFLIVG